MRFSPATALALLTLACCAPLAAAEAGFTRVWPGWRDATAFDRISEYFTGQENPGREVIVRTQPQTRDGFYFLVRTARDTPAAAGAKFTLLVIAPDSPAPRSYTFPVDAAAGSHAYLLGLTGTDWPDKAIHPVAWKLELQADNGRVLAVEKSFLWEKPAK